LVLKRDWRGVFCGDALLKNDLRRGGKDRILKIDGFSTLHPFSYLIEFVITLNHPTVTNL
jgi:hypothetical protein